MSQRGSDAGYRGNGSMPRKVMSVRLLVLESLLLLSLALPCPVKQENRVEG